MVGMIPAGTMRMLMTIDVNTPVLSSLRGGA